MARASPMSSGRWIWRRTSSPRISGWRNGTARKIAPSPLARPRSRIRAGVRTGNGSPFFPAATDENENDQLWILSSAGGEAEKLTTEKGSVDDFAWAPDSKRIVLVVQRPRPARPGSEGEGKKNRPADRDRSLPVQAGHRRLPDEPLVAPQTARPRNAQARCPNEWPARRQSCPPGRPTESRSPL